MDQKTSDIRIWRNGKQYTMQGPNSNEFGKLAFKSGKFYVKPIFTIFLGKKLRKISKSAWIARWSREMHGHDFHF